VIAGATTTTVTVKVAGELTTTAGPADTSTRYCVPLTPCVALTTLYEVEVAPGRLLQLPPTRVCH
jgi:hypothetical protein